VAVLFGGRAETAVGLAGVGELEVTGLSGRNKVYGARIGKGEDAKAALEAMVAAGQTVEGVAAARFAGELAAQRGFADLPLLQAIIEVLDGGDEPSARIADAVLPAER
jgi:glycerol-3-phosphate dehydrogenase (NAD(P)+)